MTEAEVARPGQAAELDQVARLGQVASSSRAQST